MTSVFDLPYENCFLSFIFGMISASILMLDMGIATRHFIDTQLFDLVTLTFVFDLLIGNIYVGHNFKMLRTRILNLCRGISFHGKHLDLVLNV
jgi:hypothetical protein